MTDEPLELSSWPKIAADLEAENERLRAKNERLKSALQWIHAQAGNVDHGLIKHMCLRTLAGKDPAGIYTDR